ncbi:MAG TPA: hypothetical protein VK213_12015 [Bacteroidales bacterium]|nr:hypothetical protein [Bacteroidales bacterium]
MKKFTFVLSCLLLSALSFAQSPDFSGKWSLDASKSKLNPDFSMAPGKMAIELNGNSMKVEKVSDFQGQSSTTVDQYTLDGKECINKGFMDSQKKSNVKWSDDKKSINVLSKIAFDGGEISTTEVYRMEGQNLVVDSKSTSSFGDMNETYVYVKQ